MTLVDYLNRVFEERRKKNPSYSLRAFARSLEMDSSSLSAVLKGKRKLTPKAGQKLIDALNVLDPAEAQMLVMSTITGQEIPDEALKFRELEIATAEMLASWEHFAILSLLELHGFSGKERDIAARLNVPLATIDAALGRLEKLGMIARKKGRWEATDGKMATKSAVPNKALREGHKQNILKAIESLEKDAVEDRDISGITMAISKARLPEAQKLIQDFRRRMSVFLESGNKNAVYRLNVQLFPLALERNVPAEKDEE